MSSKADVAFQILVESGDRGAKCISRWLHDMLGGPLIRLDYTV